MKLAFSLLASGVIASPTNERLITDETKCCQQLKVRILQNNNLQHINYYLVTFLYKTPFSNFKNVD